ncbi:histidine kinase [Solidesulfovibrio carbinoliphilus subsp. oakridgensis]|uniref:Histidine kinase n=1 Tax=Solidesulfovibrio carbinoliphilus subsp. oakridgensis TaxID=694327 RepID=G7Q5W4_9BACT|nr:PAS domain-containing sensor histidine kinase [Solidesulfovibrio carbinoliphilus]EHJ46901.1 histidine kinase [Solidesulfovibrio carbinoliphilus subsp. oakridgensis]
MHDEDTATAFLPAGRLAPALIRKIAMEIADSPSAASLALVPLAVAIVSDTRQIVYANDRFVALAGAATVEDIQGKRLGEALGCLHAGESGGGCGTTRFCRYCGAAQAVVKSLEGERATQECAITRDAPDTFDALNLQVWTAPLELGERRLVLNSLLDIAHEKALRGFERIFFHDILNAVAGIQGLHDLLSLELPESQSSDLELLRQAVQNIQDIVETQKELLSVETREYHQARSTLHSLELLSDLAAYCQSFDPGASRILTVDPAAASRTFSSDGRILQRIMVNMVKNALEACRAGETVTLGCETGPDGGVVLWVKNPAVLPEETRMRLFQKGFSTKGPGRGFGVYGMRLFARQCLGGEVDFESDPETGTRFFLRLPA